MHGLELSNDFSRPSLLQESVFQCSDMDQKNYSSHGVNFDNFDNDDEDGVDVDETDLDDGFGYSKGGSRSTHHKAKDSLVFLFKEEMNFDDDDNDESDEEGVNVDETDLNDGFGFSKGGSRSIHHKAKDSLIFLFDLNDGFGFSKGGSRSIHHKAKDSLIFLFKDEKSSKHLDTTESCTCSFFGEDDFDLTEHGDDNIAVIVVKQNVRFGNVEIREYASTLGDHPYCQDSYCPLSLDWDHTDSLEYDIETFECKRFLMRGNVPRRLDSEQRRDRILETSEVTAFDLDSALQQQHQHTAMSSAESIDHEDDDERLEEHPQCETFQWERAIRVWA
eukprot:CAMPEP_0198155226 /NCGR_PEP_ID=MMETSP1443-20131203/69018_1 /TAXON_ID=186043 /ORGANISM="Entomoneis sp., Strain CCMP2396" /LENGTH=332 /DNA_ID=CAMNT_0043821969 /DNA_START=567 /DNA_END=1565 /DNA_ORIENTATION=-